MHFTCFRLVIGKLGQKEVADSDDGGVVGLGSSAAGWWSKSGLIMLFCCLLP